MHEGKWALPYVIRYGPGYLATPGLACFGIACITYGGGTLLPVLGAVLLAEALVVGVIAARAHARSFRASDPVARQELMALIRARASAGPSSRTWLNRDAHLMFLTQVTGWGLTRQWRLFYWQEEQLRPLGILVTGGQVVLTAQGLFVLRSRPEVHRESSPCWAGINDSTNRLKISSLNPEQGRQERRQRNRDAREGYFTITGAEIRKVTGQFRAAEPIGEEGIAL